MASIEGKKITIVKATEERNKFGLRKSNGLPSYCHLQKRNTDGDFSQCKVGLHSTTLILERGYREWWDERCFINFVSEKTTTETQIAGMGKKHSRLVDFSAPLSLTDVEKLIDGLELMRKDMILTKADKERNDEIKEMSDDKYCS